jgi:hypothetical protein
MSIVAGPGTLIRNAGPIEHVMSKRRIDIPGKGLIQFEGVTLPEGAKYFETASFYSLLPEDIRTWVLDLRYAWARER